MDSTMDSRRWIRRWILDDEFSTMDSRRWILDDGLSTMDYRRWILDDGFSASRDDGFDDGFDEWGGGEPHPKEEG